MKLDFYHWNNSVSFSNLIMARGYWLINSNRSEVRRFTENRANEDQFNKYVFIDNGKIVGYLGKEPPLLQKREEFKLGS